MKEQKTEKLTTPDQMGACWGIWTLSLLLLVGIKKCWCCKFSGGGSIPIATTIIILKEINYCHKSLGQGSWRAEIPGNGFHKFFRYNSTSFLCLGQSWNFYLKFNSVLAKKSIRTTDSTKMTTLNCLLKFEPKIQTM